MTTASDMTTEERHYAAGGGAARGTRQKGIPTQRAAGAGNTRCAQNGNRHPLFLPVPQHLICSQPSNIVCSLIHSGVLAEGHVSSSLFACTTVGEPAHPPPTMTLPPLAHMWPRRLLRFGTFKRFAPPPYAHTYLQPVNVREFISPTTPHLKHHLRVIALCHYR